MLIFVSFPALYLTVLATVISDIHLNYLFSLLVFNAGCPPLSERRGSCAVTGDTARSAVPSAPLRSILHNAVKPIGLRNFCLTGGSAESLDRVSEAWVLRRVTCCELHTH